jgi:hypothetical protein
MTMFPKYGRYKESRIERMGTSTRDTKTKSISGGQTWNPASNIVCDHFYGSLLYKPFIYWSISIYAGFRDMAQIVMVGPTGLER